MTRRVARYSGQARAAAAFHRTEKISARKIVNDHQWFSARL
jgi:hypothetical protein